MTKTVLRNVLKNFKLAYKTSMEVYAVDRSGSIPLRFNLNRKELNALPSMAKETLLSEMYKWAIDEAVNRNNIITQTISEYFKSGKCKKGVLIIGKAHNEPNQVNSQLVPLPKRLFLEGIIYFHIEIRGNMNPFDENQKKCDQTPQIGFGQFKSDKEGWLIVPDENKLNKGVK